MQLCSSLSRAGATSDRGLGFLVSQIQPRCHLILPGLMTKGGVQGRSAVREQSSTCLRHSILYGMLAGVPAYHATECHLLLALAKVSYCCGYLLSTASLIRGSWAVAYSSKSSSLPVSSCSALEMLKPARSLH